VWAKTGRRLTGSSQHDVRAHEAGQGTLVGGHTYILKDKSTVQEEEVVGVWAEGRGQGHVQGGVSCGSKGTANVDQRALD